MGLRNISAWSIRNPVPPIVLFAALLLAGIVAFIRMPVVDSPDIDFPAVQITITQPGAAPTEIETQITQRVEASVRAINGVDEIQSTATEGSSQTFVQFKIGIDPNVATQEVKNAVDQIRSDLPDGILEPFVAKVEVGDTEIAFFSVQASDMTIEQLSWFVDDTVAKRLLGISGMARVQRAGGVDREIRVILDPQKMQSLGLTASQVNQTLRQVYEEETARTPAHPNRVVTYQVLRRNWFVASGVVGDRVFYQKTFLQKGIFKTFRIEYDESESRVYNPVTARISGSFKG